MKSTDFAANRIFFRLSESGQNDVERASVELSELIINELNVAIEFLEICPLPELPRMTDARRIVERWRILDLGGASASEIQAVIESNIDKLNFIDAAIVGQSEWRDFIMNEIAVSRGLIQKH